MPIGGVVINGRVEDTGHIVCFLARLAGVEVHGSDAAGNIVAVLDTGSSEEMEELLERISRHERVLNVGVTYFNAEDEIARPAGSGPCTRPFGFRQPAGAEP